jgi:signal transduction histidine kinase/HAMP domain-containing protein
MLTVYLTPASIGYLTQFILAAAIAGYLLYLTHRFWQERKPVLQTLLLAAAFTSFAGVTLLLFLNVSLDSDLRFHTMPLESIALALFLTFLLQFAYRFPTPAIGREGEMWGVLGLSLLDVLWEVGFALYRYEALARRVIEYRPPAADLPFVAGFLWAALTFLRQTVHASSDEGRSSAWQSLWRPRGPAAQTARALALLSLLALGLEMAELLKSYHISPNSVIELTQSLGILLVLSAFALVYLNYLPEKTSFMVKLVGISLVTLLAVLGSVGWVISPAHIAAYNNLLADGQTLHFAPNSEGGYDIAKAPFRFQSKLGTSVSLDNLQPVDLAFPFPFYGQVWHRVYPSDDGTIGFGQAVTWRDVWYHYGPSPAILPLVIDFARADSPSGGLFVNSTADELLVTWNQLPAGQDRSVHYTLQVALYPTGEFDITYNGLPAEPTYSVYAPQSAPWLTGVIPGIPGSRPALLSFATDLPYASGRDGAIQDYYLDFRRYLHRLILPLAYLVVGSSLLIVVIFPIFFRRNLVNPLNSLLAGVREINAGNLETTMPVQYHDEIGFLTQSFNDMTTQLRRQILRERQRATDLEALERMSSALQKATSSADVVSVLLSQAIRALNAQAGAVFLQEGTEMVVAGLHGAPQAVLPGQRFPLDSIPCWPTFRANPQTFVHLLCDEQCPVCVLHQPSAGDRRESVVVSLQSASQTLGLLRITFHPARGEQFADRHRKLLIAIAEIGGNALQRARIMEMMDQVIESRTHELTTLYEVTRATTQHVDLQTVLKQVLEKAVAVIDGYVGFIHLLSEDGCTLERAVQHGSDLVEAEQRGEDAPNLWDEVVVRDETVIVRDLPVSQSRRAFYIGVPIHAKGRVLGVLSLAAEADHNFSVEDITLLSGIADHLGTAVENARLFRRVRETAAQQERRRLARDLHDSVTQSIHSLVLSADTASHLLKQGRFAPLEKFLGQLAESARQALKEMRLLLYELRFAPLEQMDLLEVLQTRLEAVEQRAGIEAELIVDGPADWPRAWEEDLYCIAMEALNNALRHARASQVSVHIRGGGSGAVLEVADNGLGFDPQQRSVGGMGLRSMAERVCRLGGELTVDSAPGRGTRIGVRIPVERDA